MEQEKKHYKTIVISDVHLGSRWSKSKEATEFLMQNTCETLIMCGDIIDGWAILRGRKKKWKKSHTNFFRHIMKIQSDTKIYYLRGNHDDFLDRLTPFDFANISIIDQFIYESNNKRFYVLHGDAFDNTSKSIRWLSKLGDSCYSLVLSINKRYNRRRLKKGLPYYSIAAKLKQKVKGSVSRVSQFDTQVKDIAIKNNCDGTICGHIHRPEIRQMGGIVYMNSGDWVESLSALTEDFEGNWNLHSDKHKASFVD